MGVSISGSARARAALARIVLFLWPVCGMLTPAMAGYTAVAPPSTTGELSHESIFEVVYGGNFVQSGVNFASDTVFASRIQDYVGGREDDAGSSPLSLVFDPFSEAEVTDQIWRADGVSGTARARFANYTQDFGFVNGTSGSQYTKLFSVNGNGTTVTGASPLVDMSNRIWRWARAGQGNFYTSQPADNIDGLDHMVTYRIDLRQPGGGGNTTTYMLFFEDAPLFEEHDGDYNDMVIELLAIGQVPEPASVGFAGLLGLACLRRVGRRACAAA